MVHDFICFVPGIHNRVLVVAAVQEYATGEHEQAAEQQQQHLQAFLSAVHKISVEDVRILGRRQSVLKTNKPCGRHAICSNQRTISFTSSLLSFYTRSVLQSVSQSVIINNGQKSLVEATHNSANTVLMLIQY